MNSTNKNISRQELLGSQELIDFKNYVLDKYSPTIIQNNCVVKTTETDKKINIEFSFNQKYGSEFVDIICEPILTYQQYGESSSLVSSSSSISNIDTTNLYPILSYNDLVELSFNEKIIESYSYSTLLSKLKMNKKQITNMGSKFLIPLEFDILNTGFIVNPDNMGILKITFRVEKSPTRNIELKNYLGLEIKYGSFISSKLKIKNSSQTIKLLNHYFSQPNNKKLLFKTESDSKYIIELPNQDITRSEQYTQFAQTAQTIQTAQLAQTTQNYQPSQYIPIYKSTNANLPFNKNPSLDIRKEPIITYSQESQFTLPQNYSNIVNSLYGEMAKGNYDYDNIQPFNSSGLDGGALQSLIDYEQNDEIEEYKKVSETNEKSYYQKEKLFNKKISLICEIGKELCDLTFSNKSASFQSNSLSKLYFYFTSNLNNQNQVNVFDSIRLKLNGKTIYEVEREILTYNINKNGDNFGLYLIQVNSSNSKSDEIDNYELVFDGITQPINSLGLKIFESSKYLCSYMDSKISPQIIRI